MTYNKEVLQKVASVGNPQYNVLLSPFFSKYRLAYLYKGRQVLDVISYETKQIILDFKLLPRSECRILAFG